MLPAPVAVVSGAVGRWLGWAMHHPSAARLATGLRGGDLRQLLNDPGLYQHAQRITSP